MMAEPLTNRIIPQKSIASPGIDSGSFHSAPGEHSPTWADLIRAERTDSGVSSRERGIRQEDRQENQGALKELNNPPAGSPSQQTPLPSTHIVGFAKLRSLLQPVHKWFTHKVGYIKQFNLYQDDAGRELAYPEVKVFDRDNPYRRHQLSHKASARTYKRLRQFAENRKFEDLMIVSIQPTMPKVNSEYLASLGKRGRSLAWRLFEGWWEEDLPQVVNQNISLACHVNLHLWSTKKPVEPHYHFHALVPNYGLVLSDVLDDDGAEASEFRRWEWHRQRGGRLVPFSEAQLVQLKELWAERLQRFNRRHGLAWDDTWKVDIYVDFVDTWPRLLHKLNYNGRHWSENYAEYSNENPDCPNPPEWLLHYENKARVKGWWSNLKNITVEDTEKEKVSPYTGENMSYLGKVSLAMLFNKSVGYVDFERGKPVENDFTEDDKKWLKEVMYLREDFIDDSLELDTP